MPTAKLALVAITAAALCTPCAQAVSSTATPKPKLKSVRLYYDAHAKSAGLGDPFAIAFTTDRPLETQRTNDGLRGRAGVLGSSTSLGRLGSNKHCYAALVSSTVIKRLKIGNRYTVTVSIGSDDDQTTYHRKVTLRKVRSIATIREQLHC